MVELRGRMRVQVVHGCGVEVIAAPWAHHCLLLLGWVIRQRHWQSKVILQHRFDLCIDLFPVDAKPHPVFLIERLRFRLILQVGRDLLAAEELELVAQVV